MSKENPIAYLIEKEGTITAKTLLKSRVLEVNSPIFVQETIAVSDDGSAQFKFTDDSLLDLKSSTEYTVNAYSYTGSAKKDQSVSSLATGGFRLLSGSIGKTNPEKYQIKTPNAVIGLRGTLVEGVMEDTTLYVSCTEGQVTITNSAGSIVIGEGMEEYAIVTSYQRRPQIFIEPVRPTITPQLRPTIR